MQVQELGWRNYFSGLYENIHEEYFLLAEYSAFFKELFLTSANLQNKMRKPALRKLTDLPKITQKAKGWVEQTGWLSNFQLSSWSSLVAYMVKNPPTVGETWLLSLGWEDPLEEGMTTNSSILAWRIPIDRGVWWATVHRVSKGWTQLKQINMHNSNTKNHPPLNLSWNCICIIFTLYFWKNSSFF